MLKGSQKQLPFNRRGELVLLIGEVSDYLFVGSTDFAELGGAYAIFHAS